MTVRKTGWGSLLALLVVVLVVAGVVAYQMAWAPRPYYVTNIDAEQDYYYNVQLIAAKQPISIHHPGTPIYYLGYLLLQVAGSAFSHTQQFLNLTYLVMAALAIVGLVVCWRLVLRDLSLGMALAVLAAVVAWPSFLTYLNFFNGDGFIVAAGLPAFAVAWRAFGEAAPSRRVLLAGGALLGLALTVKMSFVPVAIALGAGYVVQATRRAWRAYAGRGFGATIRTAVMHVMPVLAGLVGGFIVAALPIVRRLPRMVQHTFTRPDAAPQGAFVPDLMTTMKLLVHTNPAWMALTALAAVVFLLGAATRSSRRGSSGSSSIDPDFDYLAAFVMLGLLWLAFLYRAATGGGDIAAAIAPNADAGIRLRNMSPSVLVVPFALLFGFRALAAGGLSPRFHRMTGWGAGLVGLLAVVIGVRHHVLERNAFLADRVPRIEVTRAQLGGLAVPPARVAFWTESAQDFLGEASFHFFGNYRYANGHFDTALLARYPSFAFFGLRNLPIIRDEAGRAPAAPARSRYGRLGDMYWAMRDVVFWDRPHYTHTGVLVSGDREGTPVGVIAVPSSEIDTLGVPEAEIAAFLAQRYGTPTVEHRTIVDVPWTILRFPGAHS